ncbi:MAG TPA: alpha/beta hydrolase family protein [Opitutaceae bacterium]|nr:alpha/beta hydrolase family protein [Opitutaceae bacterium]
MGQSENTITSRWLAKADLAPPFAAPGSRQAWEARRGEIRSQLWILLGRMPPRPKVPKVEILSHEDRDDYVVEKFQFDNEAGSTVPGYLLLPKSPRGRLPAILYCHWHAGEYDLGKEELFQAKHTPEAPGPAFARRGYVVVGIDACGFGERNGHGPDGPAERNYTAEETTSKFDLWAGRTFWGMLLRDDLMALDYLASLPEVDPDRIGVTGMSMGATRTWWLMALDERIKTGVAIACQTRYQNLVQHGSIHEHDIGYFVPGMLAHFDSEAVIALIAPRPVLFQTGDRDGGSPVDGIHAIDSAVRPVYRLYGTDSGYQNIIYPGLAHVYTPEMWAKTLAWMDEHLGTPADRH